MQILLLLLSNSTYGGDSRFCPHYLQLKDLEEKLLGKTLLCKQGPWKGTARQSAQYWPWYRATYIYDCFYTYTSVFKTLVLVYHSSHIKQGSVDTFTCFRIVQIFTAKSLKSYTVQRNGKLCVSKGMVVQLFC